MRICAVAIVAVLVADGVVVALRLDGDDGRRVPPALEQVVLELEAFVERERGQRFERPVDVRLVSDDRFEDAVRRLRRRDAGGDDEDGERVFVGLFRALGLVEGDFDPSAIEEDSDERILGFYDPESDRLLVRGSRPTPAVRRVLVHELTHALDDQHFGLERPELDERDDEAAIAFQSLVEGVAVRIEARYHASLSPEERRQAEIDGDPPSGTGPAVPRVFEALLAFPYEAGEALVDALLREGGSPRLDAALIDPPVSTEAVLHPERFVAGDGPKPVRTPEPAGEPVDGGVLGELILRLVLQSSVDRATAARAAEGWGGDRYVAWFDGDRLCMKAAVVMDTPPDRAELVAGLRRWADRHAGAAVTDTDPVTFTRCG
ncbi:MAG TPA: hypothetical protein VHF00_05620 [Acidimicrobiales bacterium]|nr:hypothetical protein [Acidimicrobiales bacterium]